MVFGFSSDLLLNMLLHTLLFLGRQALQLGFITEMGELRVLPGKRSTSLTNQDMNEELQALFQ